MPGVAVTVADAPSILRAAGVEVVVEDTWTRAPLGPFPRDNPVVVWHHDASPVGPSPGALSWIKSAYVAQDASAQFWVDTNGAWHCIGQGLAWHAGKVLDGMPGNYQAVGVETDHTVGETWPDALLTSLRKGTAALLTAWGHSAAEGLWFHKQICSPPGRKSDPDGLEIQSERAAVAALMGGGGQPARPSTPQEDELTKDEVQALIEAALTAERAKTENRIQRYTRDQVPGVVDGRVADLIRDGFIPQGKRVMGQNK